MDPLKQYIIAYSPARKKLAEAGCYPEFQAKIKIAL
jgi:hypothetical protein